MPDIRTDDTPRRLRAVWLGPRGKTLAWEWTYVQWSLCLALMVACSAVLLLLLWPVDHTIAVCFGIGGGSLIGQKLAAHAVAHTNYDQPLRWWRQTLRGEFRRSTRMPQDRVERLTAPPVAELARWAEREMR
jgi:hypothetical protein